MRLTSIKLVGFKSFVDPVTVPFDTDMTAIVGPNGCGKSNVIDAVRWVMGESSAKYLRGESMADVIFNGSTGRKPVGQASIELTFDNREGKLGGAWAQYAEIAVRRLVTREGQSQYFFNGQKCRRRDIADLFLGTGLGPRSYAIIGQGMISRLVEARPEELRATLEEAAGISRYKERRRETENRMRRTTENLERLDDLREELDKQLERLKRQAEAAKRYRELKGREHRLKGELALIRARALREQQRTRDTRVRELENSVERNVLGMRESENRLEQSRSQHDGLAETLDARQRAFYDTGAAIARLEQQLESARAREQQSEADIAAIDRDLTDLARLAGEDEVRYQDITTRLDALSPELEAAREAFEMVEAGLEEAAEREQAALEAWEGFSEQHQNATRSAARAQSDVQRLDGVINDLNARIAQRQKQRDELPEQAALVEEREMAAERLAELDLELETDETRRLELKQGLDDIETRLQVLGSSRDEHHARRSALQGERASLDALIRAALESGDEALDAHLDAFDLSAAPQLAERLQVESGWEAAVDVVLGPWLAARMTDDTRARTALQALSAGRLTLFEEGRAGSLPRANTLAARVTGAEALSELLGRVVTVASDAAAWQAREHLEAGNSVIAPSGLWLGRHWAHRQVSDEQTGSIVVNRQRRDRIDLELGELDERVAEDETQIAALREQRQRDGEALEALYAHQRQQQQGRQTLALEVSQLGTRLEHLRSRDSELEEEIAGLREQLEEQRLNLEQAREQWDQALATVEDNDAQRQQLERARRETREAREAVNARLAPAREAINTLELERQRLSTERQGIEGQRARAGDQRARLEEKREMLQAQREEALEPLEMLRESLDESLHQRTREEQLLNECRDEASAISNTMRELEQKRQGHERELETLREQLEAERMDVQALRLKAEAQEQQLIELGHDSAALEEGLAAGANEQACQEALESTSDKIRRLGAINLAAIEEYEQQLERRDYLQGQHAELTEALDTLNQAIRKIDQETRTRFKQVFEEVNERLGELFPRVFGGGAAWLTLTGDDLLETGVAIMATPPGKKNSTIHLLSGGEKTLTALSLVFAIFQLNPAPFCMLDEVDAPLDDANVGRYAKLVREMSQNVQFIYITHNKIAMEAADRLMGVTMQEPGVSRLVSVGVEEAAELVEV
ncbi:chromosome segregation protein SMC [Kushneria marisflavi]|uniref:Chromosome partition protein Smc n=1 Tax=Kushneria marisflavi TaxID=157779 RepID=A0A240UMF8_9GAMM|nr:chromosome segregation protein SMC [Kushneria marisflavi]ART62305.1 chromosome segregation protein SMC [Kushneria marisflavi]RKD87408.1 condensin subunit Smc [Kushneria marisflavi]